MTQEWITDRPPTEADGDGDGDVRLRSRPGSSEYNFAHWSYVGPGAPWQRTSWWQPTAEPATPQPDWAALGWITRRPPAEADADGLKEVLIPTAIASPRNRETRMCDYRLIVPGQPWWSVYARERFATGRPTEHQPGHAPESATEEHVPAGSVKPSMRIAALEQRVTGLLRAQDELIAAMANRLESLEQLFWAHKHEAKPVSAPADHQP